MKQKTTPAAISPKGQARNSFGLALTAGGARGAYQIGCWKAFLERGISFEAVAGSSIGALNAAFVCQGNFEEACSFWQELGETPFLTPDYAKLGRLIMRIGVDVGLFMVPVPSVRTAKILKYAAASMRLVSQHGSIGALAREGLIRIEKLEPVVSRHLDLKEVLHQPVPLFATVTEVTGVHNRHLGSRWFKLQDLDDEVARKILAASLSLPFVSPRIKVKERSYVDGGIAQWAPIAPLYEAGFRKIVIVSTRPGFSRKAQDYPDSTLYIIKPERSLGRFPVGTFRFTPHAIAEWMSQGYEEATAVIDKISLG
jgi:NTE family protein